MRLLSAVALMAVRPSPPSALVGKQARALDASDRRTYFGSRAAVVAAVAGGHSDHFSSLHDTVPSRRQASKQAGLEAAAARQHVGGGGGPVNQVSRGIPERTQS